MKKNILKLTVALIAFIVGVIGASCWLCDSFSPQNLKTEPKHIIRIVVTGRVIDNTGRPIRGAKVHASLGLDLEGAMVETDAAGFFKAEASSEFWFKVCRPNVQAYAENFGQKFIFFDCSDWDEGERRFEQTIVLESKVKDNKTQSN
jgi:hypothetical protein